MNDTLANFLSDCRNRVDHALERHLPAAGLEPAPLHAAMRYAMFAGGKRIRPALVFAAARLAPPRGSVLVDDAAVAIELVHTYSLVHDDLPAMDDDTLRRGKPTCHIVFGDATAILVGDALLTLAFEVLAGDSDATDTRQRTAGIRALAVAAGSLGMAGGQALDLAAEDGFGTIESVAMIQQKKTGALMGAAAELGAISAGLPTSDVERLALFGRALGAAFQITDDILDIEGTSSELGKTAGKDARAGKLTYPALLGVEASRAEARRLAGNALTAVDCYGELALPLRELAQHVIARRA